MNDDLQLRAGSRVLTLFSQLGGYGLRLQDRNLTILEQRAPAEVAMCIRGAAGAYSEAVVSGSYSATGLLTAGRLEANATLVRGPVAIHVADRWCAHVHTCTCACTCTCTCRCPCTCCRRAVPDDGQLGDHRG